MIPWYSIAGLLFSKFLHGTNQGGWREGGDNKGFDEDGEREEGGRSKRKLWKTKNSGRTADGQTTLKLATTKRSKVGLGKSVALASDPHRYGRRKFGSATAFVVRWAEFAAA